MGHDRRVTALYDEGNKLKEIDNKMKKTYSYQCKETSLVG